MQPLLQLLCWERAIVTQLESELQISHQEAQHILDSHPALIRKAWHTQQTARATSDQLISINLPENTHHD